MQVAFNSTQLSKGHIIKVKVGYQGYIFQKMAVSEALVFHKHILFINTFKWLGLLKRRVRHLKGDAQKTDLSGRRIYKDISRIRKAFQVFGFVDK